MVVECSTGRYGKNNWFVFFYLGDRSCVNPKRGSRGMEPRFHPTSVRVRRSHRRRNMRRGIRLRQTFPVGCNIYYSHLQTCRNFYLEKGSAVHFPRRLSPCVGCGMIAFHSFYITMFFVCGAHKTKSRCFQIRKFLKG